MTELIDNNFRAASELLDWAASAVEELEQEIQVFFSPDAGRFAEEIDERGQKKTLKFLFDKRPSHAIRRKGTEALNNIRHSFDQSLFAACAAIDRPLKSINFPWRNSPTDLQRYLESKGIPEVFWETIKNHEPYFTGEGYSGGNDYIRGLAQLANGKHTVGLSVKGDILGFVYPDLTYSGPHATIEMVYPQWNFDKNEIVYAVVPKTAKLAGNEKISLQIVIDEPGHANGINLKGGLHRFLNEAKSVHDDLKKSCTDFIG